MFMGNSMKALQAEEIMGLADRVDQVISMTDLRRAGKVFLDLIASGKQDKYYVMHDNKPVYAILPIGGDINLIHANQVISATELQRKGKELLSRLKNSDQKRFLVIRKNKPAAVLMPINDKCVNTMDIVIYELEVRINKSRVW
jgi:PHD/YefM family antitoxin component YafN of YafNO toxin-antitoxin module